MATTPRKYVKKSCHRTKSAAKSAQKELHSKGYTAKIVKSKDGQHCVMSAGMKKRKKA